MPLEIAGRSFVGRIWDELFERYQAHGLPDLIALEEALFGVLEEARTMAPLLVTPPDRSHGVSPLLATVYDDYVDGNLSPSEQQARLREIAGWRLGVVRSFIYNAVVFGDVRRWVEVRTDKTRRSGGRPADTAKRQNRLTLAIRVLTEAPIAETVDSRDAAFRAIGTLEMKKELKDADRIDARRASLAFDRMLKDVNTARSARDMSPLGAFREAYDILAFALGCNEGVDGYGGWEGRSYPQA